MKIGSTSENKKMRCVKPATFSNRMRKKINSHNKILVSNNWLRRQLVWVSLSVFQTNTSRSKQERRHPQKTARGQGFRRDKVGLAV